MYGCREDRTNTEAKWDQMPLRERENEQCTKEILTYFHPAVTPFTNRPGSVRRRLFADEVTMKE